VKVAVNATSLLSPFTGIAQYTRQLMLELAQRPGIELEFFYGMGWSRKLRAAPLPGYAGARSLVKRVPGHHALWRMVQQGCFLAVRARGPDLYHEPNFFPFRGVSPVVATIHDLSLLRYPETHPPGRVALMKRLLPAAIERSAAIITDSEFVRQELVAECRVDPAKVHAIHLAAGAAFRSRTEREIRPVLEGLGLSYRGYALTVGTLEPRKNLLATLAAYAELEPGLAARYPLAVVGPPGWLSAPIESRLAQLARDGRARALGFVADETLACLYAGARLLAYPSLYEGFGLPPLEAMASGAPVIASERASLPEVVGDAGLLVDPARPGALRDALERMLTDEAEAERLRGLGFARAARFSWRRCADETLRVFRSVL
jgi:glycosyltransferase involved in cell wall biosynthesis